MIIYTKNHRTNLKLYWQQFYPNWQIPKGYHVHHIKPKCTFKDSTDPKIHHPSNLIALHPDDHYTIHKCRGDKITKGFITSCVGRKLTNEQKRAIGKANAISLKGNVPWNVGIPLTEQYKNNLSRSLKETYDNGRDLSPSVFQKGRVPHNAKDQREYFINGNDIIVTDNLTKLAAYFNYNTHCGFSRLKRGVIKQYQGWTYSKNKLDGAQELLFNLSD